MAFDQSMFAAIHGLDALPWMHWTAFIITHGGIPLLALGVIWLAWKDKNKNFLLKVGLAFVIATVIETGLNFLVGRARPLETGFDSFPSGHTTRAFVLVPFLHHGPKWIMITGYVVAALVGISRLVLGLHWASDAIAGVVLGLAVGFVFDKAWKWGRYGR